MISSSDLLLGLSCIQQSVLGERREARCCRHVHNTQSPLHNDTILVRLAIDQEHGTLAVVSGDAVVGREVANGLGFAVQVDQETGTHALEPVGHDRAEGGKVVDLVGLRVGESRWDEENHGEEAESHGGVLVNGDRLALVYYWKAAETIKPGVIMPLTITVDDAGYAGPRNDSEYTLNVAKFQARPDALEEIDGYREHFRSEDHYTTRCYQFPWSARGACLEWLLGYSINSLDQSLIATDATAAASLQTWLDWISQSPPDPTIVLPPAAGWKMSRVIPAQDPNRPWLFASEWELLQGMGAWADDAANNVVDSGEPVRNPDGSLLLAGGITYFENPPDDHGEVEEGMAKIRVTYRPRPYAVLDDAQMIARGKGELGRYLIRDQQFNIEALPLAGLANSGGVKLKYCAPPSGVSADGHDDPGGSPPNGLLGVPVGQPGIQLLPSSLLTYTWVDVPDLPWVAHGQCVGKINANPFDGVGAAPLYPPRTLLCQPWTTKRTISPTGRVSWQITFRFVFHPQGWNYYPTSQGKFLYATFTDKVNGDPNAPVVYKSAPFETMFQIPPPKRYN